MTTRPRQLWQQLELLALQQPQRLLSELDALRAQYPEPAAQRQLTLLQALALFGMSDYSGAEKLALSILAAAIEANDLASIAQNNLLLSKCYVPLGLESRERPCLDVALNAARQARDNDLIIQVLCQYAASYQRKRDRQQTLVYLERAEKQLREDSDPGLRLRILMDTSSVYYYYQQYDKALPYISSALDLSFRLDDVDSQLTILNNIATIYGILGQFGKAEEMLSRGLRVCEERGHDYQKVKFLFGLGTHYLRMARPDIALDYLLQCETEGNTLNLASLEYLSDLNSNLAGCYRELGNMDLSRQRLDKAVEYAAATGNKIMMVALDLNKANFLSSQGDYSQSRKLLQSVIKYTRKHKVYDMLIVAQLNLIQTYEAQGNPARTIKCLKELHAIHEEYQENLMMEQSKDHDRRIQEIMQDFRAVEKQYNSLSRDVRYSVSSGFICHSEASKKVLEAALLAAQHPSASVLITGESGTGKDVLARLIHYNSARRDSRLVSVNMASISPSLMESEFFGHKKGSFTGAVADTKGFFLEASHGTLYLDEISEMPIQLQVKLLRVLESRTLTPVGSTKELQFDTRVISSTNRDILKMIREDLFRLDLYHRLNTIEIHVPPLRERPEDIEALILHYAEKFALEMKLSIPRIAPPFIDKLQQYDFPGNVRELRNIIERLLIMRSGQVWDTATLATLPSLKLTGVQDQMREFKARKANLEKKEIINALQSCDGKQKDAARLLGVSESTLTRKIAAYKLEIYTRKGR